MSSQVQSRRSKIDPAQRRRAFPALCISLRALLSGWCERYRGHCLPYPPGRGCHHRRCTARRLLGVRRADMAGPRQNWNHAGGHTGGPGGDAGIPGKSSGGEQKNAGHPLHDCPRAGLILFKLQRWYFACITTPFDKRHGDDHPTRDYRYAARARFHARGGIVRSGGIIE